jgi:hypothetical protein
VYRARIAVAQNKIATSERNPSPLAHRKLLTIYDDDDSGLM